MIAKRQGTFITIEGIDLVGKSTLLSNLEKLKTFSNIVVFSEFSESEMGQMLKKLLKNNILLRFEQRCNTSFVETLLLLSESFFRYDVEILPLLIKKMFVVKERFIDSHIAYQIPIIISEFPDLCQSTLVKWFEHIVKIRGDILPDLTIILDCEPEIIFKRYHQALTEYERRILTQVRNIYLEMPHIYPPTLKPERITIIKTTNKDVKTVTDLVIEAIQNKLFEGGEIL